MENEKDRCGEKMPFVERANEDFYFAARDRELIEEMKADSHACSSPSRGS